MIAVFAGIICARLYYVLFNLEYYLKNPSEIFAIWNGGLAIYGGIIGGTVTAVAFCKIRKIKFLNFGDYLVPLLALCQSIGRWGNFVNQEAYGSRTENFFKMRIFDKGIGEFINVHPTFLYESVLNFSLFIILMYLSKKKKFEGQLICIYFIVYGMGRFFIEGLRVDSLMLANFRVSQVFSAVLVIFSIIMYIIGEKCRPKV